MLSKLIKRLGLKRRSLPSQKTIGRYIAGFFIFLFFLIAYNVLNIFVSSGFPIVFPKVILPIIPIILFTVYHKIEGDYDLAAKDDMIRIISLIQMNHTQALYEELNANPDLLSNKYKNKSLLYWARHYNNADANSIIIKLIKSQNL